MSDDKMYLQVDEIGRFDAGAQYPPFVFQEPIPTPSGMPGIGDFNRAAEAAVALGNQFDTAACAGVQTFKGITRRCGAEYSQNDVAEATNIARTAATQGEDQVKMIDINVDYPYPSMV